VVPVTAKTIIMVRKIPKGIFMKGKVGKSFL
jgi:hypothetical protein